MICILLAVWLILCAPSIKRRRAVRWGGTMFAHRGLYGEGISENSLPAFEQACKHGYGIELDVQSTSDGVLMVFHDDDAMRMTGDARLLRDMTYAEVRKLQLQPGGEVIPTFDEVLDLVSGRAPMLVEIKNAPDIAALTRKTADRLRRYDGPYIVESFNPLCLFHLRRYAPEMIRGQLVSKYTDTRNTAGAIIAFGLSALLMNVVSRPDFIAYSQDMPKFPAMWLHRKLFHTPLAAWTIIDKAQACALADAGEMPIFEKIRP